MDSWRWMSAADLGRGIEEGKIDPVDLTDAFLSAIDTHEYRDRIYVRVTADRARAEAAAASKRAKVGTRRGPLDGVPISWKDLFDTAGIATESGSALLAGRVSDQDAKVLATATAAGLVCLGKTHQTELAFSGLGYNPITASPPGVNDPEAVSGGSSSGAATSVAFGLAAAGIGSDTGGSVRVPAAWNDLVGLKTLHGRLSLEGVVPLCARFDTVGPLTRTVEDASLLLSAMEAGQPADLTDATLQGRRLAVLETSALEHIEKGPREGFESAVSAFEKAGANVERITSGCVAEAMPLSAVLYPAEAYATWRDDIEAAPDKMFERVLVRFRQGRDVGAADFIAAWQLLDELRLEYRQETAAYDAVLVPTCPILPPKLKAVAENPEYFTERNLMTLRNTRIGNLMGLAAITLPTGTPSVGITLQGTLEERLLRLAAAAERALA